MSHKNFRSSASDIFMKNRKIKSPIKDDEVSKTVRLKKLKTLLSINNDKILEIKGRKKAQPFHLVGENDKYKIIEKNIQNKILNISMLIIDTVKFNLDLAEITDESDNLRKKERKSTNPLKNTNKTNPNNNLGFFRASFNMGRRSSQLNLGRRPYGMSALEAYKDLINEKNRRIKKIPPLYDSFGEDESDKEMNLKNYGLNPKSLFIDIYDCFLIISVIFYLFYTPFRLAKTKMVINDNEIFAKILIYFSEIIFIIDVIFGFFRWYYNNEFKLITDKNMIITHYFYGYLFFDLIMAIPFYSIFKFNIGNNEDNITYNENNYLIKSLICLKAFKIFKVNNIKNNRVIYFINKELGKNIFLEKIYQISNFVLIVLSVFNLFVCFHIYMAYLSYPNWIISSNLQDKSFIQIYLSSLYFIMATLTSVGYGDIVCIGKQETLFQILLLSIGLVAYSWIISTVGDYVKNKSRANLNYNRDMTKLEELRIQYPNMPYKLYNKIQQHIQRILTQSKKYEYHILVNTLPYYLKNLVLFQIHKTEIERFTFFKNCDNSDFILKVLTHFIPVFPKQNILLVGEGEFFENIFFIKEGRLSLEAIIDLNNIEMSIEKYLKYRFEEIELIEDFSGEDNTLVKRNITNESGGKSPKSKKYFEIINKQFENIDGSSSACGESDIEQEIGKCDFHLENQDFYGGDIQYIHILDLLKNEHFGESLMFLNIPNPLSLRVKSKRADLYILRRKDALNIKRDYQNIWKRINKKSIHNIKSLKSLTLDIINRYCEMNGLLVKGNEIINLKTKKTFNLGKAETLNQNPTFGPLKLNSSKNDNIFLNIKNKESSKNMFKIRTNINKERKKNSFYSIKGTKNKSFNTTLIMSKNINFSSNTDSNDISNYKNLDNKISDKSLKNNNFHKLKIKNSKNKKTDQNISTKNRSVKFKLRKSSFSAKCLPIKYQNKNIPKIGRRNNASMKKRISTFNESDETHNFHELKKESTINFKISSSYNNINEISKGQYIKENNFQDLIKNIVNYFFNLKQKDKINYEKQFNYFKILFNKISHGEYDSEFAKVTNKKQIVQKPSFDIDINKKKLSKYTKSIKNKNFLLKKLKRNISYNNPKEISFSLQNQKYILESGDIKSINNKNQLQLIKTNKYQEKIANNDNINNNISKDKLVDDINYNISKNTFNNNKSKCKHSKTFQKLKKENDNNFQINKKKTKKDKPPDTSFKNNIIKNENNFREVNLNYVNNFCHIF